MKRFGVKKIISIAVIFLLPAYPALSSAAYLIELINGNKFITSGHWEEGGEIRFYYYGGVVGFPKEIVREIRESDLPYNEPLPEEKPSKTDGEIADEAVMPQGNSAKAQPPDDSAYRARKESLKKQIAEAMNKYNASLGQDDKKEIAETYQEAARLSAELKALKKEVKEKYGGKLPDWWQ